MQGPLGRRLFLKGAAAAGLTALSRSPDTTSAGPPLRPTLVGGLPSGVRRPFLGSWYWGNGLQDWQLSAGRIECVDAGRLHTVAVLPVVVLDADGAASLRVRTGTLAAGAGFSGFLVGGGGPGGDYRRAALVQTASGTLGGLLCCYEADGRVGFREHTDEVDQLAYARLAGTDVSGPAPRRTTSEDVELHLELLPAGPGRVDLRLTATAAGVLLSRATRRGVRRDDVSGGLALVSSPEPGAVPRARYWFSAVTVQGAGLSLDWSRQAGPVLGTLFSLDRRTLKLTAQLMPIGPTDPQTVTLEYRVPGSPVWRTGPTATVGAGYTALFRVRDWDASRPWQYRVGFAVGTPQEHHYGGTIPATPLGGLRIGLVNCTIHSFRPLDRVSPLQLSSEAPLGLYTDRNLYFPYEKIVRNLQAQGVDLLVGCGDQFYETRPTRLDLDHQELDFLYRYYLWLWSFRSLTANVPGVLLVDDHDVDQSNLWGWSGRAAPDGDNRLGGYVYSPDFVNTVQRVNCGHDPDPYDPTPVQQGIGVYYGRFVYGGVSFALLEDRKFKDTNIYDAAAPGAGPLPAPRQLLGARQEAFLRAWRDLDPGLPKIVLTQTLFACLQTREDGTLARDFDSNGAPAEARARALRLIKDARALVLSGDQHLASLVRHGLDGFADGPVQFTAPAAGTSFQRWFAPPGRLPGAGPTPHTGDVVDAFGNRLHVQAVANPKVSFAALQRHTVGDQAVKAEGYGLVRVDTVGRRYVIECWPYDADVPAGSRQYPGWPWVLPFDRA